MGCEMKNIILLIIALFCFSCANHYQEDLATYNKSLASYKQSLEQYKQKKKPEACEHTSDPPGEDRRSVQVSNTKMVEQASPVLLCGFLDRKQTDIAPEPVRYLFIKGKVVNVVFGRPIDSMRLILCNESDLKDDSTTVRKKEMIGPPNGV